MMTANAVIIVLMVCFTIMVQAGPRPRRDCTPIAEPQGDDSVCGSWKIQYTVNCAEFPPIPGPSSGKGKVVRPTDEEIQQILDAHNKYRAETGVDMPQLVCVLFIHKL